MRSRGYNILKRNDDENVFIINLKCIDLINVPLQGHVWYFFSIFEEA